MKVRGAFESNPELISADGFIEITGFKVCACGLLEALWGSVEALGTTYMEFIWADTCSEIRGFRKRFGALWKHRGAFT